MDPLSAKFTSTIAVFLTPVPLATSSLRTALRLRLALQAGEVRGVLNRHVLSDQLLRLDGGQRAGAPALFESEARNRLVAGHIAVQLDELALNHTLSFARTRTREQPAASAGHRVATESRFEAVSGP